MVSEGVRILLAGDFSRGAGSTFRNLFLHLTGSCYWSTQAPAWLRLSGPHHTIAKHKSNLESRSRTKEQVFRLFRQLVEYSLPSLAPASRCFWKFAVCQAKCLVWHSAAFSRKTGREAMTDLGLRRRRACVGEPWLYTAKHYVVRVMGGFFKKTYANTFGGITPRDWLNLGGGRGGSIYNKLFIFPL